MRNLSPSYGLLIQETIKKTKGVKFMKKSLVLALVACFVLSLAGTAMAFPIDFSGEFDYQLRSVSDSAQPGDTKASFSRILGAFNFSGKVDDTTTVFGRFSGAEKFGPGYNQNQYAPSTSNNFALDNFGVKGQVGDWNYSLGREGVSLGQGGILATGDLIGYPTYFDGLVASTKFDNINFKAIAGRINGVSNTATLNNVTTVLGPNWAASDSEWYGAEVSTTFGKATVGLAAANEHFVDNLTGNPTNQFAGLTYTGANISVPVGVIVVNSEYIKSSASTNNTAFTVSGTYSWDKDSFTLGFNNVQENSVDPLNGGLGYVNYPVEGDGLYGYSGLTYSYTHKISPALKLSASYMQLKSLGEAGGNGNKNIDGEGTVQLKWSF